MPNSITRREFLRTSAAVSGGLLLAGHRKSSAQDAALQSVLPAIGAAAQSPS